MTAASDNVHRIMQDINNLLKSGGNPKNTDVEPTYLQEIVRRYLIQEHSIITRYKFHSLEGIYKGHTFKISVNADRGTINYGRLKQKHDLQDPKFDIQAWIDRIANKIKSTARYHNRYMSKHFDQKEE